MRLSPPSTVDAVPLSLLRNFLPAVTTIVLGCVCVGGGGGQHDLVSPLTHNGGPTVWAATWNVKICVADADWSVCFLYFLFCVCLFNSPSRGPADLVGGAVCLPCLFRDIGTVCSRLPLARKIYEKKKKTKQQVLYFYPASFFFFLHLQRTLPFTPFSSNLAALAAMVSQRPSR